jgi:predicted Zn-dependent protease
MRDLLESLRDAALRHKVDFMDVRAVEEEGANVSIQDGRADRVNQGRSRISAKIRTCPHAGSSAMIGLGV